MGAFFAIHQPASEHRTAQAQRLDRACRLQGFASPQIIEHRAFVLYLYPKQQGPAEVQLLQQADGSFCALVGTLIYQNQTGLPALAAIHQQGLSSLQPEALYGNFCLIHYRQPYLELLLDPLGIYKSYRAGHCYSSSFLALLSVIPRPKIRSQSLYEYLFQGAVHGETSLFAGLDALSPDQRYRLTEHSAEPIERGLNRAQQQAPCLSEADAFELNWQELNRAFSALAAARPRALDTALSGGFDSRLLLALLLEQGLQPSLHVYGSDAEPDVQIARHICQQQGWPLDYSDESRYPIVMPEAFGAIVAQNFQRFDGLPVDGIFNDGMDWACRQQRGQNGRWMLNGGGGEIYRNFFYLADGDYSISQLLSAFYSQHDPALTTARFDERQYFEQLATKIGQTLRLDPSTRLSRQQVELVYPLFRCRYWMGRNNAINNRLAASLTPFIDYSLVAAAARIPLAYKNHGRFEAELIARLNPVLASYPSVYGHHFAQKTPWLIRVKNSLSYHKPGWLRRHSYRLRHRHRAWQPGRYLSAGYWQQALPQGLHYLPHFIALDRVREAGLMQRLLTLEYLLQYAQASLSEG